MGVNKATNVTTPGRTGSGQPNTLINVAAFVIFAVLWLAFAVALLISQRTLDVVWAGLRGLPLLIQGIAWLLLLPVVAGLWIWQQEWGLWLRLLLIAGLAVANLVAFYPWRQQATPSA